MKKQLITFFVFLTLLIPFNKVFSYWLELETWNNFYSSIVDNLSTLESQIYTIEITWEDWINEKIKKYSWLDCLSKELTEEDIVNIVDYNERKALIQNFSCKDNKNINLWKLDKIVDTISHIHKNTQYISKMKTKQIFDVSNVWIYSDWIDKNWPFDLIIDLEQIDEIIFEKKWKEEKFEWWENIDLEEKIKNLLKKSEEAGTNNNENENEDWNTTSVCDLEWWCLNENNNFWTDIPDNWEIWDIDNTDWINNNISDFTCKILWTCKTADLNENKICTKHNTSLNSIYEKSIIKNIEKKIKENSLVWNIQNWKWEAWGNGKNWGDWKTSESWDSWKDWEDSYNNIPEIIQDESKKYKKLNDNEVFPCNNFFCIKIESVTNNHNWFWWWVADAPSIEFLLERSNKHLKKFAATSQVQAKMSINNWESILKDLNLADTFHMWMQISKKPVPILDLNKDVENEENKEEQKEEWELALKSQLKKYYELHWLSYKMRNDLSLYRKIEQDRLATLNANFSNIKLASEKFDEYLKNLKEKQNEIENLKKTITETNRSDIMKNFELQFKEIDIFNKSARDYVNNLDTVITNMLKIPVDSGTT